MTHLEIVQWIFNWGFVLMVAIVIGTALIRVALWAIGNIMTAFGRLMQGE